MFDDHSIPVAYLDDEEVAWLQMSMWAPGIYNQTVELAAGFYILHKEISDAH